MALVKCHECGREISTEAKTCPQCGARNKNRKRSRILWFLVALTLIVAGAKIYPILKDVLNPNFCETDFARKAFVNTFDRGPYAQRNKLRVVDIRSVNNLSRGVAIEESKCEVVLRLNDGKEKTYIYSFEKAQSNTASYIVHGEPK